MKTMDRGESVVAVFDAGNLTDDELLAMADNPRKVKEFLAALVQEEMVNGFAVPLSDKEVNDQYPQFADRIAPWRKLADLRNYDGPIAWLINHGFNLKQYAPMFGPCFKKLQHIQGWDFNDDLTEDCLVFWLPFRAEDSTNKNITKMEAHRAMLKKRHKLPGDHATTFGSIQILFVLILAHFRRTGERVPLHLYTVASDTMIGINRLIAGSFSGFESFRRWKEDDGGGGFGLDCGGWDENGNDRTGFMLVGVEKLGQ